MVEVERSRFDVISDLIIKYPIESHADWWLINMPDVYAGYDYAKSRFKVPVKKNAGLKLVLTIFGLLAVFALIVYFIFTFFLSEGLSAILG